MLMNMLRISRTFHKRKCKRREALYILLAFLTITGLGILSLIYLTYALPNISSTENVQVVMLVFTAFICWMGMSFTNRTILAARNQDVNFEAIFNNIADGVLIRDLNGNFVSANPALLKMIPESELREMNANSFTKTMRWKRKFFAVTTTHTDGGDIVIFRDQTRCRETEQARDALLATVSHEFRTPLTAVMNYLEMLLMLAKMRKTDNEAFVAHLTRALENSHRLQHLVVNVIEQAQLQAGMIDLKQQHFNLREFLQKSIQPLELASKHLPFHLAIAQNLPAEIKGDPKRLNQAIGHLIENAIKFTDEGEIRVRAFMPMQNKMAIEVTDTGAGIPEEQLPDIFEAFRRASNYAHREHQGAGLGLSIAKQIITSMGGEITVTSTLNAGSTFTIWLPVKETF